VVFISTGAHILFCRETYGGLNLKRPIKERPVFPVKNPLRKISDERGVSPVIAVILMVAITVVLSAVLFVMVRDFVITPDPPEYIRMDFEEDEDTPTKYIGEFDGSKELHKIQIKVVDKSHDTVLILRPSEETSKQIPGGLNITYTDINANNNLDIADILVIYVGESGDEVTVLTSKSGKMISQTKLN
jgi:flagellin-like protein